MKFVKIFEDKERDWERRGENAGKEDGRDGKTPSRKQEVGVRAKTFPNKIKNKA